MTGKKNNDGFFHLKGNIVRLKTLLIRLTRYSMVLLIFLRVKLVFLLRPTALVFAENLIKILTSNYRSS